MPWRCLPLPQAPHSDYHCIACVPGRHRHTRGGFGRVTFQWKPSPLRREWAARTTARLGALV